MSSTYKKSITHNNKQKTIKRGHNRINTDIDISKKMETAKKNFLAQKQFQFYLDNNKNKKFVERTLSSS